MTKTKNAVQAAKVECVICGYRHHILSVHLAKKHDLSVSDYITEHKAPWYSEYGRTKMVECNEDLAPKLKMRKRKTVDLDKMFPEWLGDDDTHYEDTVSVFASPTKMTPTLNPAYVFPEEQTLEILTVLDKPTRNNIFISGGTGTGKSELVRNLASKYNAALYETNMDRYQTRSHLFGGYRTRGSEMYFEYGIVPKAMVAGGWLVLHEWDTADPALANILKPVLETNARLTLTEKGGEVVVAHPDFRVLTTNNTWSRGDDSGSFVNTEVQSVADLRRFHAFVELNYLEAHVETQVVQRQVPELTDETLVAKFIEVANATRKQYNTGVIDRVISTAEVVNWCENYVLFDSPHRSARVSFLRAYDAEVARAVGEHINNVFGQEDAGVL